MDVQSYISRVHISGESVLQISLLCSAPLLSCLLQWDLAAPDCPAWIIKLSYSTALDWA